MSTSELARMLSEHGAHIVTRFVSEVARTLAPQGNVTPAEAPRSLLVDHVPDLLEEMVSELRRVDVVRVSQELGDTSEAGRQHGEQRWNLGYDLEALIREYGILRHCILETAKVQGVALAIDDFDVLAKCLSVGVAVAASAYVKHRDVQLEAQKATLQFLAEAGQMLSSSLDMRSTLSRLSGLLVPRMADWCAIHLDGWPSEEMPLAHVDPTKLPLLRALYSRYPSPPDAAYGYPAVARSGEPQFVPWIAPSFFDGIATNPEHLGWLRELDACSWVIVPLSVQGRIFGALTLAYSSSRRRYTDSDVVLIGEVARRAAAALDNAHLFAESQRERARVEAATRAKDEFVAMVSHELRTPLNAILGWARLLRGGALDEGKRARAIEVIERNAEAQGRLVADLLDISRIMTGKARIDPAQVDLSNVVDMAIEAVAPAAEAKRIRIQAEIDRENAVLRGDADRLQQVVWHLFSNAVKFTPKGGSVAVSLRRVESDVEIVVRDDGEGIAPSFLPYVFESFRQYDGSPSRPHGGLGVGLSIVKYIVEQHGGAVSARSDGVGRGATFVVKLPVSPLVSTTFGVSRVPATQTASSADPAGAATGIRVLVVDDEPDAREVVSCLLELWGMEVRSVPSAEDALRAVDEFTPHVIVSDIGMPDEDGYTFIRRIRTLENRDKSRIPALALTAFARAEDRTRALVAGFNMHLVKPVEPAKLVQAVRELAGTSVPPSPPGSLPAV